MTNRGNPLLNGRNTCLLLLIAAALVLPLRSAQGAPRDGVVSDAAPGGQTAALVQHLTTETVSAYETSDGSYRLISDGTRANYNDSGTWRPIDSSFVRSGENGVAVENAGNSFDLELPEDGGEEPVRIASGSSQVEFQMDDLLGAPSVDYNIATYETARDAQAVYEVTPDGLKESITLQSVPSRAASIWSFSLELSDDLHPELTENGAVDILSGSGQLRFSIPPPYMVDSASPRPGTSSAIKYDLDRTEDGWSLRVVPEYSWLVDPDRVYPVLIDPSVTLPAPSADSWIGENSPTENFAGGDYVRVGGATGQQKRAVLRFALPALPSDAWVTNATLQLYLDSAHSAGSGSGEFVARRLTENWTPAEVSWNRRVAGATGLWSSPGGSWQTSGQAGLSLSGSSSGYKTFDVTAIAAEWVQGGKANHGVLVRKKTDGVNRTVRFYTLNASVAKRPVLDITFDVGVSEDPCASDPAGPSCADGVLLSENAQIAYEDLPVDVVATSFSADGSVDIEETIADLETLYETDANYQDLSAEDVQGALSAAEQMLQDPPPASLPELDPAGSADEVAAAWRCSYSTKVSWIRKKRLGFWPYAADIHVSAASSCSGVRLAACSVIAAVATGSPPYITDFSWRGPSGGCFNDTNSAFSPVRPTGGYFMVQLLGPGRIHLVTTRPRYFTVS
ncbi:DNRLRE domain-containing protein [Nocardioides sambongensis]|uniref:DNRLRE domain-containing protein n=1 Tax=Nocardioides sambongensis TaxID=2589074 RepID=UPI00112A64A4|nr:DNRLRE domain-containing protein [Nocardioides sambongensis]